MITAKGLVEKINASEIYTPFDLDEVIDITKVTEVTTIDFEEHRWYAVGTVVYKIGNEFFGVSGPVTLKSEDMMWSDIGIKCEAFEMEEIPSVTYRPKSAPNQ